MAKYEGALEFKVQVERGALDQLFMVPNSGTNLGSLAVRKLALLSGREELSLITSEHPGGLEGDLVVRSIRRTLTENNSVFSKEYFSERNRERQERISVLGSYDPKAPFEPDWVAEGTQVDFGLAALNIYNPRPHGQTLAGILEISLLLPE